MRLMSQVYYVFLIQGETGFPGVWEAVPKTSFFSPKVQWGVSRRLAVNQKACCFQRKEKRLVTHGSARSLPEAAGPEAPSSDPSGGATATALLSLSFQGA